MVFMSDRLTNAPARLTFGQALPATPAVSSIYDKYGEEANFLLGQLPIYVGHQLARAPSVSMKILSGIFRASGYF